MVISKRGRTNRGEALSPKITCPICHKEDAVRLFDKEGRGFFQCNEDRLVYINPQPEREDLQEIYDTYGKEHFVLPDSIAAIWEYPDYRKRFLEFRRLNRLLEIGAAAGGFLLCCEKDGWDAYGVELSAISSRFAREQQGLNVVTGTLHDAKFASGFFDVAVAWQTLEHVPNPREVVTEVFRILRPGGFFVLSVPCWNGLSIRLLREKYRYVGRDHLFYFSPQNMRRMLGDIGFSKVSTKTGGFNPIVWYEDIRGRPVKSEKNRPQKIQRTESTLTRFRTDPFLKPIHQVYYKIIEALDLGDTLFAEALKE